MRPLVSTRSHKSPPARVFEIGLDRAKFTGWVFPHLAQRCAIPTKDSRASPRGLPHPLQGPRMDGKSLRSLSLCAELIFEFITNIDA